MEFVKKTIDITKVTNFTVDGCSAGGLAVYTWLDYIHDDIKKINPNLTFFGVAQSGMFEDQYNYATHDHDYTLRMQALYSMVNEV